ncbi:MAG TPA: hypothetical protein GXZ21_11260 [Clostridiales bacterium]|nr:hypothetical protein [Clostridiales bacterium]
MSNMYNNYYGKNNGLSSNNNERLKPSRGLWDKENLTNDDSLIIEDNTIYEIDMECYERMLRKRKSNKKNNR